MRGIVHNNLLSDNQWSAVCHDLAGKCDRESGGMRSERLVFKIKFNTL